MSSGWFSTLVSGGVYERLLDDEEQDDGEAARGDAENVYKGDGGDVTTRHHTV